MKSQPRRRLLLRSLSSLVVFALALLLSACGPEEYVHWAPDGNHALVKGSGGNYLIDAAGTVLGKMPASETWLDQPWMPDSRRVIAVRSVKAKSLSEYVTLLGESRAEAAYAVASKLLKALQTYEGKMDDFPFDAYLEAADSFTAAYKGETGLDAIGLTFAFIAEKYPEEFAALAQKLGKPEPGEEELMPLIYELVVRTALPSDPASEQILLRSADEISWVRSSPNGQHIAFVQLEPVRPALCVIPAAGGSLPIRVDEGAMQADWTADGRWLAYAKTKLPYRLLKNETQLGTITRRALFDEKGSLLAEPQSAEDLAGILFHPEGRVAYLPDGRILFASAGLSLPVPADARSQVSLYAVRIGETIAIEQLVSPEVQRQLPNRPDRFTLSPDGKRVAIPSDSGGEVAVLSLETGKLVKIQEQVPAWQQQQTRPAPTWRSAAELCYIVPAGHAAAGPRRAEVVLQRLDGSPRALSKSWPDAMTSSFLPQPK